MALDIGRAELTNGRGGPCLPVRDRQVPLFTYACLSCQYKKKENLQMPKLPVNPEIIDAAIQGFEYQKAQIEAKIAELRALRSGTSVSPEKTAATPKTGKRALSVEARERIAAAQRKRWAATRKGTATVKEPKTRRLSAAGRKAIIAATKKRWAAVRDAKAAANA
jgi:hypothetical protein